MYSDDSTPEDACDLFHEISMEDARLENRMYAHEPPDYFKLAVFNARREFTPGMFQDEQDSDFVNLKELRPETDADVALAIALGRRNEYGLPITQEETDRLLARTRAQGLAYKAWLESLAGQERALNANKQEAA